MAWRKTWQDAKDESEKKFKLAYKSFIEELDSQIDAKDKKARAKALDVGLGELGLNEGPKYTSYCKFNADFGPNLDKLETMFAEYDSTVDRLKSMTVEAVLKNKKLAGDFRLYCEKVPKVVEITTFLFDNVKKTPAEIYTLHVDSSAQLELNLNSDQVGRWKAAHESGDWSKGKAMVLELVVHAIGELRQHWIKAPVHKIFQPYMVESAGGPSKDKLSAQVDKVREIATAYGRQVQAYGKRWKDLKPDFWTPLNVALNTILSEIDAKAK